jgi:hypothetical protein
LKLKSFGDSFIYGTDLADAATQASSHTWPAQVAQHFGWQYHCAAVGGIGNARIFNSLVYELIKPDYKDYIYVIQWTWRDRFDYADPHTWQWQTIRPTSNNSAADFYYRNLHSDFNDIWFSLEHIFAATQLLKQLNCRFIMTGVDSSIIKQPIDQMRQDNKTLDLLREQVLPYFNWFDSQGFLEWSRKNNYQESELWHPLEAAHAAAAEYAVNHWAWT